MIKTIITGGSKGIGKNIIDNLLKNNHKIYNLSNTDYINNDNFINKNIININCDINNNNMNSIINKIINDEKVINNFINCAGITKDVFFHKMTYSEWINVQNINFISLYKILNPIVNNMRNNNSGNIILMSSINAKKGQLGQTN